MTTLHSLEKLTYYQFQNLLFSHTAVSPLCITSHATWAEMKAFARPADILDSAYRYKKTIESLLHQAQEHVALTDESEAGVAQGEPDVLRVQNVFSLLVETLNVYCVKWHAMLCYTNGEPMEASMLIALDAACQVASETAEYPEPLKGQSLFKAFWEDTDAVRQALLDCRDITAEEILRLQRLVKT